MISTNIKIKLAAIISIGGYLFFSALVAKADTQASSLNVSATIVNNNSACVSNCGGGNGDNSPSITAVASSTTADAATITWTATDDKGIATSTLVYGPDTNYGNSSAVTGAYQAAISGLTANTIYYFKIVVIDTGNNAVSYKSSFVTQAAGQVNMLPPVISNINVNAGITTATIAWDTNELSDTQALYGETLAYGGVFYSAGKVLNHSAFLDNLKSNTAYHFQVISTDKNNNQTASLDKVFKTNSNAGQVVLLNVSNLNLSVSAKAIALTWQNPSLAASPNFSGVKVLRKEGSRSANAADGLLVYSGAGEEVVDSAVATNTEYYYTVFSYNDSGNYSSGIFTSGKIIPAAPACNDCMNSACCSNPVCAQSVACAAPRAEQLPEQPKPYIPPGASGSLLSRVSLSDVIFLAGNRQLVLNPQNGVVASLPGSSFTVMILNKALPKKVKSISLIIDGADRYQLILDGKGEKYSTDIGFPKAGNHSAYLEITYETEEFDSVAIALKGLPYGLINENGKPVAGATASLYQEHAASRMNTADFGFSNPIITGLDGSIGWLIPNGNYYLVVEKKDYDTRQTLSFSVNNNVVNESLEIIKTPPSILNVIKPTATIAENTVAVAGAAVAQANVAVKRVLQTIGEARKNIQIQKLNTLVVAPSVVGAAAVGAVSLISFADVLPLLRLLFLQPLLLLGRRKRQGWGQVYNSLNKLPVDLATLRLINVATGKVAQTKVTDRKGRYAFIANPGEYRIEVVKNNLLFPSPLLAGYKDDGQRPDIYHGETIKVTEQDAMITANIPLDPVGEARPLARLRLQKAGRAIQVLLSWAGLIVTACSVYLSPSWYMGGLMAVHLALFLIFRRLALPPKIRSWGIVYDEKSKSPVSRTIARLFNMQFNKLVSTQITDKKGRYYFLAGDNKYYVTFEHPEYNQEQTSVIDLSGKEAANITEVVALKSKELG